ncbi:hypothetical protein BKA70DRAFT_1287446 [Coprinopsis sp. MPI-PUGE-AT-0042]|nr:hypothetical protein BKA70DRAFT_1287446 [Coprinopsis sp. MPI-PUGE-AT-0042]
MDNGPPLTPMEKTQPPKPKHKAVEGWLQKLDDRSNPTRKRIIKFLCQAVSDIETDDEVPFKGLEQRLLQLCLENPKLLCGMVRTPFLDNQTPLQWAIAIVSSSVINPQSQVLKLPSLLSVLLKWSIKAATTDAQFSALYDTIFSTCCERNSNSLLQCFNIAAEALPDEPTFYYTMKQHSQNRAWFSFVINDFRVRMLTTGFVNLMALFKGRVVSICLSVEADGAWILKWGIKAASVNMEDEAQSTFRAYKSVYLFLRTALQSLHLAEILFKPFN